MQATPAQRLTLLEALDREQKTAMEERANAAAARAIRRPRRRPTRTRRRTTSG